MPNARRSLLLWASAGLLIAVILVPTWRPLARAWACYWGYAGTPRADAEVLRKLEGGTLALRIGSGPHAGRTCTAGTAPDAYERTAVGDVLRVVYRPERPGHCETAATVERSGALLAGMTGAIGLAALGVLGGAAWLHRSHSRAVAPRRRMPVAEGAAPCPVCGRRMAEGYLVPMAGVHWREEGAPVGLPHALSGLPGTVGWWRRPRLHAFRCAECAVVSFQYGRPEAPAR